MARLEGLWRQTRREQRSYRDTLNLFFGALIGANLGTLGALTTGDYVRIVLVLLAVIAAVQLSAAARSRGHTLIVLAVAGVIAGAAWITGALRPAGLSPRDFSKIVATVVMWVAMSAIVELTPVIDRDGGDR